MNSTMYTCETLHLGKMIHAFLLDFCQFLSIFVNFCQFLHMYDVIFILGFNCCIFLVCFGDIVVKWVGPRGLVW